MLELVGVEKANQSANQKLTVRSVNRGDIQEGAEELGLDGSRALSKALKHRF